MKRFFLVVLFSLSCAILFAQQSGLSQSQISDIKSALQRIAVSNNAVENIIYDGMTFQEVLKILRIGDLDIQATSFDNYKTLVLVSYVGKYLIYWSGLSYQNPIVIGYSVRGSSSIRHNTLE